MKTAIYPGSFDPIHTGHLNVIKKAAKLFDILIVVVSNNAEKNNQTDINERLLNARDLISIDNVKIIKNSNKMTIDIAKENNAKWIIRSGRNGIDFKYELELAAAYKYQYSEIETIMIVPDLKDINYKSRLIKQGVI